MSNYNNLVKIVSEKLVKPSSPTPPSSKFYKLTIFDAHMVNKAVPMAFFYLKERYNGVKPCMELLESSLSKTLVHYYPFAGRLTGDELCIDCNDAGVQLREVRIHALMSEILDHHKDNSVKNVVFPPELYCCTSKQSRLIVHFNHFMCGGFCVAILMSHELGDGKTLSNFFNDWAMITRAMSRDIYPLPSISPIFPGISIFPPLEHSISTTTSSNKSMAEKDSRVTQRFVFSGSNLSKLKKLVTDDYELEVRYPSKVEVVTALIFKYAVLAFEKASGLFKSSSLSHAINFRPLIGLPLSENYVGNLTTCFTIDATEKRELRLSRILTELRKSRIDVVDTFRSACLEGKSKLLSVVLQNWIELGRKYNDNSIEMYIFSSVCKIPFYQVDFGWGNPIYFFSFLSEIAKKVVLMMDTPDGEGIEAFVTLEKEQMSIFESEEELLSFATLNPNICVTN